MNTTLHHRPEFIPPYRLVTDGWWLASKSDPQPVSKRNPGLSTGPRVLGLDWAEQTSTGSGQ